MSGGLRPVEVLLEMKGGSCKCSLSSPADRILSLASRNSHENIQHMHMFMSHMLLNLMFTMCLSVFRVLTRVCADLITKWR